MVKVSIEVRSGAARFRVAVHTQSIAQAVGLVAGRYKGVKFPMEAGGYFVDGPGVRTAIGEPAERLAA